MLKTQGKQGVLKKRITVTSNDPKTRNLTLEIKAEIMVDVMVEPRNVGFKQLGKGVAATELVTVKVPEPEKIKVTGLEVDDPRLEVKMASGDLATDSKWEVKFKGSDTLGSFQAKLTIKYTAADEAKTLEVPIRISVVGDLQYVRSVHFGKSPNAGFSEREVRLSSRSGQTVKIKKVEDADGLLKIDVVTPEGNPAVFKATVQDADADYTKPTQHVLKVHTSDKDEPIVEISYMISLRSPGRAGPGKDMRAPMLAPRLDGVVPSAKKLDDSAAGQKPQEQP